LEGKSEDAASRIFEIIIANESNTQKLLSNFEIVWHYQPGITSSISEGSVLQPIAKYILEFPVDVLDESSKNKVVAVYPHIVIPPKNENGRSLTTIQVQIHYSLSKPGYHPSGGWNIIYDLTIVDDTKKKLNIFQAATWN
jgi:hypothetical protein